MNPTSLRLGREVLLLACRPKAVPPQTPADSYGIQRTGGGTAPRRCGWRPTAALTARAAIVHAADSRFWPRPDKATATSYLRNGTPELRGDEPIDAAPE